MWEMQDLWTIHIYYVRLLNWARLPLLLNFLHNHLLKAKLDFIIDSYLIFIIDVYIFFNLEEMQQK